MANILEYMFAKFQLNQWGLFCLRSIREKCINVPGLTLCICLRVQGRNLDIIINNTYPVVVSFSFLALDYLISGRCHGIVNFSSLHWILLPSGLGIVTDNV